MSDTFQPFLDQRQGDDASFAAAVAFALRAFAKDNLDCCLPVKVVAYDRDKNKATVQPLINKVLVGNKAVARTTITNVQCLANGAGGFVLSFPIKQGDKGWIIAADRDISDFKRSLETASPSSARMHNFADCWFIPDVFGEFDIIAEDDGRAVFQSNNGFSRVSVGSDDIKIHAGKSKITITDTTVVVDTTDTTVNTKNFTVNSQASVINSTTFVVNATSTFNGGIAFNAPVGGGAATATCSIPLTISKPVKALSLESETFIKGTPGVDLVGHSHDDPQGGQVGPPK